MSDESEYAMPLVKRRRGDIFVVQEKSVLLIDEDQTQSLADALSEVTDE